MIRDDEPICTTMALDAMVELNQILGRLPWSVQARARTLVSIIVKETKIHAQADAPLPSDPVASQGTGETG